MEIKITNVDFTSDKQTAIYCIMGTKENGKKIHTWQTAESLSEETKNKSICFCLTYIDYDFFDNWTHEHHPQTFSGAIFDSIEDFEQWAKKLTHKHDFVKMDILG
jgi:hypothetical protein